MRLHLRKLVELAIVNAFFVIALSGCKSSASEAKVNRNEDTMKTVISEEVTETEDTTPTNHVVTEETTVSEDTYDKPELTGEVIMKIEIIDGNNGTVVSQIVGEDACQKLIDTLNHVDYTAFSKEQGTGYTYGINFYDSEIGIVPTYQIMVLSEQTVVYSKKDVDTEFYYHTESDFMEVIQPFLTNESD